VALPIPLPDDLVVDEWVVALTEDKGQQPAIPVLAGPAGLDLQPHMFAFQKVGREPAGISTVILRVLAALDYLECVHDDQPHLVGRPSADRPSEAGAGRGWIAADDPICVSTWSVEKSRQLLVRSLGMVV